MVPSSDNGAHQSVWTQGNSSWTGHHEHTDFGTPNTMDADGTVHAIINDSIHSVDVPLQNPNFQDHEMFSWLHFPMEEVIEKGLCSDFLRELPGSNVQIIKHSFNQLGLQPDAPQFNVSEGLLGNLLPPNPGFPSHSSLSQGAMEPVESLCSCPTEGRKMVAGADAAMVVDGGQGVCANAHRHSSDTVNRTQSLMRPCRSMDNVGIPAASTATKLQNLDTGSLLGDNMSINSFQPHNFSSAQGSSLLLPALKPSDGSFCTPQPPLQRNFTIFSSAVAETRANLDAVSSGSGPTSIERARQPYGQIGKADCDVVKPLTEKDLAAMQTDPRQLSLPPASPTAVPPPPPRPPPPPPPMPLPSFSGLSGETSRDKGVEDNIGSPHLSHSAITASNKAMEKLHIVDQTDTSPSRGSASSSDKSGKEAGRAMKRRCYRADDSEYQSEDLEETATDIKKLAKRSRAAEMHNLCERKRRDRINEKLMALRDLMPNSSKTAKASILDEAIEYVKLLQSQLQLWSSRTGMCIPPALIPAMGLQMPVLPHMNMSLGMGMGVGMGMGMGVVDVNAAAVAAGHSIVPLPSFAAQHSTMSSAPTSGSQPYLPATSVGDGQDHLQSSQTMDPYSMYMQQYQAQMQPAPGNMNIYRNLELYNAFMQGQQHQQQQWQQLQHQHKQWQLQQQQQLPGKKHRSRPAE